MLYDLVTVLTQAPRGIGVELEWEVANIGLRGAFDGHCPKPPCRARVSNLEGSRIWGSKLGPLRIKNNIQIDERGETYRLWEGAMEGKSVKKLDVN